MDARQSSFRALKQTLGSVVFLYCRSFGMEMKGRDKLGFYREVE